MPKTWKRSAQVSTSGSLPTHSEGWPIEASSGQPKTATSDCSRRSNSSLVNSGSGTDAEVYLERHSRWILGHLTSYPVQERYTSFQLVDWANRHYEDHRAVEDRLAAAGRIDDLVVLFSTLTDSYRVEGSQRALAAIDRIDRYLVELPLSDHDRGVLHLVSRGCRFAVSPTGPHRRPTRAGPRLLRTRQRAGGEGRRVDHPFLDDRVRRCRPSHRSRGRSRDARRGRRGRARSPTWHSLTGRSISRSADDSMRLPTSCLSSVRGSRAARSTTRGACTTSSASPPRSHATRETHRRTGTLFSTTSTPPSISGLVGWSTHALTCAATAATGDVESTRRQFAGRAARGSQQRRQRWPARPSHPARRPGMGARRGRVGQEAAHRCPTITDTDPQLSLDNRLPAVARRGRPPGPQPSRGQHRRGHLSRSDRLAVEPLADSVHPVAQRCPRR